MSERWRYCMSIYVGKNKDFGFAFDEALRHIHGDLETKVHYESMQEKFSSACYSKNTGIVSFF